METEMDDCDNGQSSYGVTITLEEVFPKFTRTRFGQTKTGLARGGKENEEIVSEFHSGCCYEISF